MLCLQAWKTNQQFHLLACLSRIGRNPVHGRRKRRCTRKKMKDWGEADVRTCIPAPPALSPCPGSYWTDTSAHAATMVVMGPCAVSLSIHSITFYLSTHLKYLKTSNYMKRWGQTKTMTPATRSSPLKRLSISVPIQRYPLQPHTWFFSILSLPSFGCKV